MREGHLLLFLFIAANAVHRCDGDAPAVSFTSLGIVRPGRADSTKIFDAVVVGGGLTGGTTAVYLARLGYDVIVAEATQHFGGQINTKSRDGYLWEEGPNSFTPTPQLLQLIIDLGLNDSLIHADPKAPRYIYWDNRLHSLPMRIQDVFRFQLVSVIGRFRAMLGFMGIVVPAPISKEETIDEFVSRHLGREVMMKVADPFVSGVYAGDPRRLSMKAALG